MHASSAHISRVVSGRIFFRSPNTSLSVVRITVVFWSTAFCQVSRLEEAVELGGLGRLWLSGLGVDLRRLGVGVASAVDLAIRFGLDEPQFLLAVAAEDARGLALAFRGWKRSAICCRSLIIRW